MELDEPLSSFSTLVGAEDGVYSSSPPRPEVAREAMAALRKAVDRLESAMAALSQARELIEPAKVKIEPEEK